MPLALQVPKDIQFADSGRLFPWGPKKAVSVKNEMAVNGAICGLSLLYALVSSVAGATPIIGAIMGMGLSNIFKQYQYFPVAQGAWGPLACIFLNRPERGGTRDAPPSRSQETAARGGRTSSGGWE